MKKLSKIGIAALAVAGMGASAYAAGTASGEDIANTATVDYTLGGVTQPQESASDTFVVDAKIAAVITPVTPGVVSVNPDDDNVSVTFRVVNIGNHETDYALFAANLLSGAGVFNLDTVEFYIDDGDGIFNPADGSAVTLIDDLAADTTNVIHVVGDVPATAAQGENNNYELTLTAQHDDGTAITETPTDTAGTVDFVVGDGAGASGTGAYTGTIPGGESFRVNSVTLAIAKSSTVLEDPINGTSNPKRIPGALIEYTIEIDSTGSDVAVEGVVVTDDLSTEIGAGTIVFVDDHYGANQDAEIVSDSTGTPATTYADGIIAANVVTVSVPDVAVDTVTTVSFVVEIQ
jgi:hypothetical protein